MENFPKLTLFPTVERVEHFAKEVFRMPRLFASHGDHEPRGASADLDSSLYDHPQLPFDKTRGSEDMNRWDDCGNYFEH